MILFDRWVENQPRFSEKQDAPFFSLILTPLPKAVLKKPDVASR